MHARHELPHRAASLLFVALAVPTCPAVWAQQTNIDCKVAFDLASAAYQGVRDALSNEDEPGAYRMKDVFWRIEKYANGCKSVRKMGEALAADDLGEADTIHSASSANAIGSAGSSGTSGSTSAGSGYAGSTSGSSGMSGSSGGSSGTGASGASASGGNSSGNSSTPSSSRH